MTSLRSVRARLAELSALIREAPELFRVARQGAICAVVQQPVDSSSPLGAVHTLAAAEGQGAHPGGVIRGRAPCAASHPHRDVSRSNGLRELAERARQETFEPGYPYDARGDWSGCVEGMLGGATGEYCAALGPDVLDALLDERDRYRDALYVIADNPCATPAGPMGCEERSGALGGEWCSYCLARAALDKGKVRW